MANSISQADSQTITEAKSGDLGEQGWLSAIWYATKTAVGAAGEAHLGEVGGRIANPTANVTRPADVTAYASGDLVANSVTAGSVVPMSFVAARVSGGSLAIRRARLKKSAVSVTLATFRLHLYSILPTVTNGDNAAWASPHSGYLGSFDLDMAGTNGRAFSDSAGVAAAPAVGAELNVVAVVQTIFGLLEARAGYTPASAEVFTVILECVQN